MPLFLILVATSFNPSVLTADLTTVQEHATTTQDLIALASSTSKKYGLNTTRFLKVIERESGWEICAKGDYVNGVPTSYGLAQLHYPQKDWGVSKEEACDPYIALEIMAKAWTRGEQMRWSAWRELYG